MNEQADFGQLTETQQKVWSDGNFAKIGELAQIVAEELIEELDPLPGERCLDVATGAGNAALAATKRTWGGATGLDYVPELIERARARAEFEALDVEFVVGDAQDLPFEDASFDVVSSIFGVMFAPDQQQAADELLRVTKPGGRIGVCSWTPDGWAGEMFGVVAKHAPPPPGLKPSIRWGDEQVLREMYGDRISELRAEKVDFVFRYRSPEHWLEYFRQWFGPTRAAFERVGPEGEQALADDLLELNRRYNTAGERAFRCEAQYLRTIAVRA